MAITHLLLPRPPYARPLTMQTPDIDDIRPQSLTNAQVIRALRHCELFYRPGPYAEWE